VTKSKKDLPWLRIALGVAAAVLLLELYRTKLREPETDSSSIPVTPQGSIRTCARGDKKCVAERARKLAVALEKDGRKDVAQKLRAAADELDKGNCEPALEMTKEVRSDPKAPYVMEELTLTTELVQVCVLDDYMGVLGDAGGALFPEGSLDVPPSP
jgi:hypothetical protein